MRNLNPFYKDFVDYKIKSWRTYYNLLKKIHNLEDLRYAWGLMRLGWHIAITKIITNETLRGK